MRPGGVSLSLGRRQAQPRAGPLPAFIRLSLLPALTPGLTQAHAGSQLLRTTLQPVDTWTV